MIVAGIVARRLAAGVAVVVLRAVVELGIFFKAIVLADGASLADAIAIETARLLDGDGVTVGDSVPAFDVGLHPADTAASADGLQLAVGTALAEPVTTGDSTALAFAKFLADVVGTDDSGFVVGYLTNETPADTTSTTDSAPVFQVGKNPSDTVATAEAMGFDVGTGFADTATTNDAPALTTGKALADATSTADAAALTTGKNLADTSTTAEAGRVFLPNYIDNTYFAADYIGTTVTF